MTDTAAPTAWLYIRLSQDHSGAADSLQGQETALRRRAAQEGLAVAEVVSEGAGRSAYGKKGTTRPEWNRLLRTVPAGTVVMAVEYTRLSRDTEDGLKGARELRLRGAHVLTLDGHDSRREVSDLSLTVRLAMATEESRLKSERVRRRKADQKSAGIWTNRAPYGHVRTHDARLRLDPVTAPILRRIVDEALDGAGALVITRGLNAEGILGPNGRPWGQPTVSRLLRSPVLCGWYPVGRSTQPRLGEDGAPIVAVEGPTVITASERARLLATTKARTSNLAPTAPRGGRPSLALLRGILRCGRCGGAMTPTGSHYSCQEHHLGRGCEGMTATTTLVDEAASHRFLSIVAALDPAVPADLETLAAVAEAWMGTDAAADEEAAAASGELAQARESLAALEEDFYVRSTLPRDRFVALHERLSARTTALEAVVARGRHAVDLGPVLDLIQSAAAWSAASIVTRRAIMAAALESVTIAPAAARGARFSADRLTFKLR